MGIKSRIQDLCKQKNITSKYLEEHFELGKGYISKIDKSKPNTAKIKPIADYFGVTLDYLMTGNVPHIDYVYQNESYYLDIETARIAQEIRDNDKILFDAYKGTSKDRLIAYAKKLMELERMENGEDE